MDLINQCASTLDAAAVAARATAQFSTTGIALTLDQAYAVQTALVGRRVERGSRIVGVKMGFTSRAKAIQMGVHDQIWGRLTADMEVADGGSLSFGHFVHPRVEPEVAFRLKAPLSGIVTPEQALAAVDGVTAALEIIDSRYSDFKFSLADVVADNASSAAFVVGPWQVPGADLRALDMVMSINGQPRQMGTSAAILGDPLLSLVAASRLAGDAGITLQPGWIVLAGAATAAEALAPGDHVTLEAQELGRVEFQMTAEGSAE
jgi:2-oxo-3-hexenedioate decarboxylase